MWSASDHRKPCRAGTARCALALGGRRQHLHRTVVETVRPQRATQSRDHSSAWVCLVITVHVCACAPPIGSLLLALFHQRAHSHVCVVSPAGRLA